MKITVWGINYAPETTGIGPCTTALCRYLADRDHQVRVVTTFPYYPSWEKQPAGKLFQTERMDGVAVHRCWHYVPRRVTPLRRILHEASFVGSSFLRLLTLQRPDLFIIVSPPLLLGPAAWLMSFLRRAPFLFHVQDLQPDAALSLGLIKSRLLVRVLLSLERFSYSRASCISGISQGMLELFRAKGVPEDKLLLFPNLVSAIHDLPSTGQFRQRHQLPRDRFLAVYAGNLGQKQGLETLVRTAPYLAESNIHLVLCGEGTQRDELAEQIRRTGCSNLLLLPLQSAAQYAELLVDADLCLIPQQPGTGRCFFPSKLLSALAYGKPVLAIADSESELVQQSRKHQFGWDVPPGRPELLAQKLKEISLDRGHLGRFRKAGFSFIHQFEPEIVLPRFEAQLQEIVGGRRYGKSGFRVKQGA